jgi:hypothetical protein
MNGGDRWSCVVLYSDRTPPPEITDSWQTQLTKKAHRVRTQNGLNDTIRKKTIRSDYSIIH